MPNYVYIDQSSKKGRLAISENVFIRITEGAISFFEDVILPKKSFSLHGPIKVDISRGIVHVKFSVDVKKGINIQEMSLRLQQEISNRILAMTDQIPFDIQIKTASII